MNNWWVSFGWSMELLKLYSMYYPFFVERVLSCHQILPWLHTYWLPKWWKNTDLKMIVKCFSFPRVFTSSDETSPVSPVMHLDFPYFSPQTYSSLLFPILSNGSHLRVMFDSLPSHTLTSSPTQELLIFLFNFLFNTHFFNSAAMIISR